MRRMPPVVEKALKDRPSSYVLGLKDGTILEFTGAGHLGDTGWVKLEGVKPIAGLLSRQAFRLDRGLEVAVGDIVWATDVSRGS
jgi:hypothetical protein